MITVSVYTSGGGRRVHRILIRGHARADEASSDDTTSHRSACAAVTGIATAMRHVFGGSRCSREFGTGDGGFYEVEISRQDQEGRAVHGFVGAFQEFESDYPQFLVLRFGAA